MKKRLLLAAIALVAFVSAANATVCLSGATPAGSATLKDAAGTPNTFIAPYADTGDGSGNCEPRVAQGLTGTAAQAWYMQIIQGGSALSATNGIYGNILQGNAVLSATNGLYANVLQGNAANSATNPFFTKQTDGTNGTGTFTAYGTAPTGNWPGVNAFVTNANPNPGPARLSALSNTVVQVKGTAATVSMLQCGNTNASQGYVQIFNLPSASVTLGSTAPTLSIPIAATSTGGFAIAQPITLGGTGYSVAATTNATGSTALGTALDCNTAFN